MVNKNKPFLLTPLRKGERKLTYVGMLVATSQKKIKQGGLVMYFSFSETQH